MCNRNAPLSGFAKAVMVLCLSFVFIGCSGGDSASGDENVGDLPKGHVDFTHLPLDLDDVTDFIGLGAMQVFPKDHGGFFVKNWAADAPSNKPVFAPVDGVITVVDVANFRAEGDLDLSITLNISSTIYIRYGHVDELSENIISQLGTLALGSNRVNIKVRGGEQIGWIGQWPGFDVGIVDKGLSLSFIHAERYPEPHRFAGYYFDYFTGSLEQQLLEITTRTIEPRGGKVDYDRPGRIIGNWFLEGTVLPGEFLPFNGHMSIAYGYLQGDQIVIADGFNRRPPPDDRETSGSDEIVWIVGDVTAPENIGMEHGMIKYEYTDERNTVGTVRGVFLIELIGPERLRFERFVGETAVTVNEFTLAARIYYR
jgi:hypothetical protein